MKTPEEILAEVIAPYLSGRDLDAEAEVAAEIVKQLLAEHVVLAQSWSLSGNTVVIAPLPAGTDARKMLFMVESVGGHSVSIQALHPENVSA